MKKLAIVIFIILSIMKSQAQDFLISFAGSGETSEVNTVQVTNLTSGISVTLNGNDILHLTTAVGISNSDDNSGKLQIYPNPITDVSFLSFDTPEVGNVIITVSDLTGKSVYQITEYLSIGTHSFRIAGLGPGMYFINITGTNFHYSTKLISQLRVQNEIEIECISSVANANGDQLKKTYEVIDMPFTTGDRLLYKGISEQFSTVVTDIPIISKTITFNFVTCTDSDGNNYSTVTIGNQIWMVENLKTTRYNDGTSIPFVTDDEVWMYLTTPAYCWYNNDAETYKDTYGALYNWFTVNTGKLAPSGWSVPTNEDWTLLAGSLGGEDGSGSKMKETGVLHWDYPNFFASNESGFTALPGGGRFSDGSFSDLSDHAYWWSETENLQYYVWIRFLSSNSEDIISSGYGYKEYGFSVRCVKD
jgi:uncharacterized protein (TIGR02145 family)